MIFGNIVYVCNTCEKKFSACWWCFSWLGQKVKASMHSSCMSTTLRHFDLC